MLKKLRRFNILSLLVTDAENKSYVGRLSVWDIANMIVTKPNLSLNNKISEIWSSAVGVTAEDQKALKYGPGGLESIYSFTLNSPIEVLLQTFTQGIHRVLITNWVEGRENVMRNFSQSDLIRTLLCSEDIMAPEYRKKTLGELKVITRPAVTVRVTDKVADTLKKMSENKICAVAVSEDNSNKILTTFSSSDLRGLDANLLQQLRQLSVGDFLLHCYGNMRRPITVTENSSLEDALSRLTRRRVHQLWEVDKNESVVGVISMTDILRTIADTTIHAQ